MDTRRGTTLIDLIMSIAIIALLFGGIYLVFFSIETAVANVSVRNAATTAIRNEVELVRNLPYGSVGTVGGIPNGVIPQLQTVTQGNFTFVLQTTVLNIDDPYDSSPSSSPVADYKLVDITASCPLCENFIPIEITTTVAPSLLAQGTIYGSIFIYAIDANGLPVPTATVRVVNASVTPSIDLTDTTNASGVLKLIGVPTSSQGYQIFASKNGYSSAQTYPVGGAGNTNPVQPNITVASQTVSNVTFAIDRLSSLAVTTGDSRCAAKPNETFSMQGSKLIGSSPDVLKFSTTTKTNGSGAASFPSVEWDTYAVTLTDATQDVVGTIPFDPITINPSSTQTLRFVLAPASDPSLLVSVADASTGGGIPNATVSITKGGATLAAVTDHAALVQSDWSGGSFSIEDGGIDTSQPGVITLLADASTSAYATSSNDWLVSNTFDLGGSSSTYYDLAWTPAAQPTSTAVEFQVAANNDSSTWNFVGPDGTPNTYFTSVSTTIPAALDGRRYFRYEVFMNTTDPSSTPQITSVSLDYAADCTPPAQAFFSGLAQGNYLVDVTATGYAEATGTAAVGTGESTSTIIMTPQ